MFGRNIISIEQSSVLHWIYDVRSLELQLTDSLAHSSDKLTAERDLVIPLRTVSLRVCYYHNMTEIQMAVLFLKSQI